MKYPSKTNVAEECVVIKNTIELHNNFYFFLKTSKISKYIPRKNKRLKYICACD